MCELDNTVLVLRLHADRPPELKQRVALLVVSSDRGLCGAYNSHVLRTASQHLNALDAATGGRSGPFDGGEELARVKVSHSKLARDFDRIKASHDETVRWSSSSGYSGGVDSSGDAGGSSTWARDEAPLGSAAAHGNGQQSQMVMQREVSLFVLLLQKSCMRSINGSLTHSRADEPFPNMPTGGIQQTGDAKS